MSNNVEELATTYTKTELIAQLEAYGDIIVTPEDYTWNELASKLRYHRCANCVEYESRELCHTCTGEILHAYDSFYEQ